MSRTSEGPTSPGEDGQILEARDLQKSFGERRVLRGVDLSLAEGEILALLGPNGAGKTTLVRSICGRLELDGGRVRVANRDPRGSAEARGVLGLVPQEIGLYPELTVRENLQVLGRLAGVPRRRLAAAVDSALEWTGLGDRVDDRADRLSGGMRRRLNLAAGTLHEPRLLLLDEPTVGVDPGAREVIHDLLRRLRRRGLAILLTTHDLDQAAELADRIALLVDGEVRAQGTLNELVRASFGDAKEISVRLLDLPDPNGRAALGEAGLSAAHGEARLWSGPLAEGLDSLASLGARLASSGLNVEELRVREPGLRGVFFQQTGREFDE